MRILPSIEAGDAFSQDEMRLQEEYRSRVKKFDQIEVELKAALALRRMLWATLVGAIALFFLLGYTVAVGIWDTNPEFARWAGLIIFTAIWISSGWQLFKLYKKVAEKAGELRNALQDRQSAAALLPLDSPSGLRIYRESSLDLINQYRTAASRNRRIHNFFQLIIISGSIVTSTLTAMNAGENLTLSICTSALSALVGISAGVTGYFKFRERGYNQQSTADEIEKHYNASQFMFDDYDGRDNPLTETERLRKFASSVERLKEEQRKRELQLEQSSSGREERSS